MSERTTFVDACLQGDALLLDVDDWVDRWHDASGAPNGQTESLGDYLGLTQLEYSTWVERPESLRFAIAAHRGRAAGQSITSDEVAEISGVAAAAARAGNDVEAAGVVHWLRQTGRLSP
jgi:hypothetical protein